MAELSQDKIREHAYFLWLQDGQPETGNDWHYWLLAEQQLLSQPASPATVEAVPDPASAKTAPRRKAAADTKAAPAKKAAKAAEAASSSSTDSKKAPAKRRAPAKVTKA